jgi:SAM-dependent methyltransferase
MSHPNAYYDGGLAVRTYDLFTRGTGGALAGDLEFYRACVRQFGATVLELGTGTGRVLLPLARDGCVAMGLDASQAMLEVAAAKLAQLPKTVQECVKLVRADMQDFDLARRFTLALIPARAFQHLIDPANQRKALCCIHRHLVPGGHLVIDLFDPRLEYCVPDTPSPQGDREVLDPASGLRIRRTVIDRVNDPFRQTISEKIRFEALDQAGKIVLSEETSWMLRWTMRQEMAYLLELCEFDPVEQFSDFSRSPPAYGQEQIWIARAT